MALPSPRPRAGWKKAGRREKREESKWPPARFTEFLQGPKRAGWCRKGSVPRREERRRKRARRREKRQESRDKREERREKTAETNGMHS